MEIKLNEKIIDYKPEFPITWEEFLSYLLRNYVNKKHGITRIVVDNLDSIELMTDNPKKLLSKDIKLIEIHSNDSLTITKVGFEKILQIIIKLKPESILTADLYREGKIKEASENIIKIINTITPVIYFVTSVEKSFNFNFAELSFSNDVSVKNKMDYFVKSFGELVTAQEKGDYIELADYLEYQFTDDLIDWEQIIAVLTKEVEHSGSNSN